MNTRKRIMAVLSFVLIAVFVLSACQPTTVEVIKTVEVPVEVEVVETVEVVTTQEVTVVETQVVEVEKPSFSTPHPILSDIRMRQAIAYCTNRPELIASVYSWASPEIQESLLMDTNIPRVSWAAYYGDEVQKYPFDPEKGKALLEEAGWTGEEGDIRSNADGERLSIKFTTTSATFRQLWGNTFVAQMKDCGIEILPLYAPGSWWFGSSTGLRRRDFELGAFAWVGETDPKGQTLYACNQIPLAENGWAGQNYMGWCNEVASDAINAANNSLSQEERKEHYKTFQIEFAKDMISLPVFQRAEGNAATQALVNFKPNPTEYYTWNAYEWERTDGDDTLVLGLSQEPATMYTLIESAAVQRTVAWLVAEQAYSQYNYNFQPRLAELSTVDAGLTVVNEVTVKEGDPVVDAFGTPTDADGNLLTLTPGLMIQNAAGETVEYTGGDVAMKQLVITYKWQPNLTWSDGEPVKKADFELAYKNDCDETSGAVDYSICQSIQSVDFTSDNEYVVTYKPGYFAPLSFLPPIGIYPSHQVLSDGRTLNDVPTTEWSALPEIAVTPLGVGPYILKSWEKGVKMELEENPYYWQGPLKIKNIVIVFIPATDQAVAQLLTGDVDVLGSETLGAGPEVQTVLDNQDTLQVLIEPSATWEHIDMNLFIP
jgi:ABC-type transport system substrate-binding protein